jgi:hypothetical protein
MSGRSLTALNGRTTRTRIQSPSPSPRPSRHVGLVEPTSVSTGDAFAGPGAGGAAARASRAEAAFKRKEDARAEGLKANEEYEGGQRAMREKTAGLRALRLARRSRLVSHAAVSHVHAVDEGITEWAAALDNSPAHHRDVNINAIRCQSVIEAGSRVLRIVHWTTGIRR